MWSQIIDEMENEDQVVDALQLICPRHPDQTQLITKPGEIGRFCPGGGCLLPCATQMPCGHICPSSVCSNFVRNLDGSNSFSSATTTSIITVQ